MEIGSLGLRDTSRLRLGRTIHAGLPAAKVENLLRVSGWTKTDLFRWAHIPPANGHKRFRAGQFHDHESERIARLATLFDASLAMLRDPQRASDWLRAPNPRLGGAVPIEAAGTELGAAEVHDLIGRLRHGVY